MIRRPLLIVAGLTLTGQTFAQTTPLWSLRLGDTSVYTFTDVQAKDSAGNMFAVGAQDYYGESDGLYVAKVGPNGNLIWQKSFWSLSTGSDLDDNRKTPRAAATDPSGNIWITGDVEVGGDQQAWFVVKLFSDGTMAYSRIFDNPTDGGNRYASGRAIQVPGSDAVFVGGTRTIGDSQQLEYMSLQSTGAIRWTYRPPSEVASTRTELIDFARDSAGQAVIVGTSSASFGYDQIFTTRVSANGFNVWSRTWGTAYDDRPTHIVIGPDRSAYILGSTGASPDGQDLLLLRYGLGGTLASEWFGDGERFEADLPSALTLEPTTNLPHIGYRTIAEDSTQSYFVRRFDNRGLPILGSVQAISGGGNRSLLTTSNSPRSAVAYGSFLSGTGNPVAGTQSYDGSLNLGPRTTIGLRGMPNLTLHNAAPYPGGAFGVGVGDNGASATFDGALVRFGTPGTLGASIAPNAPYVAAKGTLFTDCPSGVVSEVVDRAPVGYTTVYKDGSFRFSPPRDFHGTTSFTYRLNTSRYMSGIRTFEITVQ